MRKVRVVIKKSALFCLLIAIGTIVTSGCFKKQERKPITTMLAEIPPSNLPEAQAEEVRKPTTQKPLIPLTDEPQKSNQDDATKQFAKRNNSVVSLTNPKELDFEVTNLTGKTLYVTCFAYQRKSYFRNWRWDKSPVYEIESGKSAIVDIDTIPDESDRKNTYGYLGVFPTRQEAEDATVELTHDRQKLDLDVLYKLKGKRVTIEIERYGVKGEFLEYDFVDKNPTSQKKNVKGFQFAVENNSGRPVFVTCFVYQKKAKGAWIGSTEDKDDMAIWRFDKTNVIRLEPYSTGIINTDDIMTQRDRSYLRGYLGVFTETEEELANKATFELLEPRHKLNIGVISEINNKKIMIDVEEYGIQEDFFDFVIKPTSKIDFTKPRKK